MSGETAVTIVGNLTSDPELRYTQAGLAVANFTIASTPRVLDRSTNEWGDGDTLFLRASIWRDYAEHAAASLRKGARVVCCGTLRQQSYETKPLDGSAPEKRTSYELAVDEIGPALRYATASVSRVARLGAAAPDAWIQADTGVSAEGQLLPS